MSPTTHIQHVMRYFPHGVHPGAVSVTETTFGYDHCTVCIEKNRNADGLDYYRVRCIDCEKSIELPVGYDWETAWMDAGQGLPKQYVDVN